MFVKIVVLQSNNKIFYLKRQLSIYILYHNYNYSQHQSLILLISGELNNSESEITLILTSPSNTSDASPLLGEMWFRASLPVADQPSNQEDFLTSIPNHCSSRNKAKWVKVM